MIEQFNIRAAAREWAELACDGMDSSKGLHEYGAEEDRTIYGFVGQWSVCDILGGEMVDDPHFDFMYQGLRCEAKTISCAGKPRTDDLATVNSSSLEKITRQNCDCYIFARVDYDLKVLWIVGWETSDEFFKKGKRFKKGDIVFTSPGGKEYRFQKAHGTVMFIRDLRPFSELNRKRPAGTEGWHRTWDETSQQVLRLMGEGPLGKPEGKR